MQEFLASFAVDIDEAGVSRLQKILRDNRDLAGQVAEAFDSARKAMEDLFSFSPEEWGSLSLPTFLPELPETSARLSVEPDFTRAGRSLSAFLSEAKKQMRLTADASGIISAASDALSRIRAMFASANLVIRAKIETEGTPEDQSSRSFYSSSSKSSSPAPVPASDLNARLASLTKAATGGRFSSPTQAEIAEDGDPEYVVPVKKEKEAVPLIRGLLSELSASAKAALRDALPPPGPATPAASFPAPAASAPAPAFDFSRLTADLSGLLASAPAASAPPVLQQSTTNSSVQAPVNIHVEAASADPEAVGRSIYNVTERYLLRTLKEAHA